MTYATTVVNMNQRSMARMTMTVRKKPGEHTAIVYRTIKFDPKIPDSKFTEQALRK